MKKLLLILLCLPLLFTTCKKEDEEPTNTGNNVNTPTHTYVPDDNFENYLEANGMGDGIALNDSVLTANIIDVTYLDIGRNSSTPPIISDLTGIENFTALTSLDCHSHNAIEYINLSNATNLRYLDCAENQLKSLDLSQNPALEELLCFGNQLTSLDLRNGNNTNLAYLYIGGSFWGGNLNLYCINVDSVAWSTENWSNGDFNIPPQSYFCN